MTARGLAVIYDLRIERSKIEAMQATSRSGRGLSDQPALVGSEEWWRKIAASEVSVHVVEGVVGDSYWTGHGDYPQFDLVSSDGVVMTWERYGDETRYVRGLAIRLEYVEHPWHPDEPVNDMLGHISKIVFSVELEETDRRETGRGKHP